jgi:hypothetical protein
MRFAVRVCSLAPQFSLRTLLVVMLLSALATQIAIVAKQREQQRRREQVLAELRANLVCSQRMEEVYAQRFLRFVERKVTMSTHGAVLRPDEQREFLHAINAVRSRREVPTGVITTAAP